MVAFPAFSLLGSLGLPVLRLGNSLGLPDPRVTSPWLGNSCRFGGWRLGREARYNARVHTPKQLFHPGNPISAVWISVVILSYLEIGNKIKEHCFSYVSFVFYTSHFQLWI